MEFVFIRNKTTYFVNVAIFEFDIHGTRGYAVAVVGKIGNKHRHATILTFCRSDINIPCFGCRRKDSNSEFAEFAP